MSPIGQAEAHDAGDYSEVEPPTEGSEALLELPPLEGLEEIGFQDQSWSEFGSPTSISCVVDFVGIPVWVLVSCWTLLGMWETTQILSHLFARIGREVQQGGMDLIEAVPSPIREAELEVLEGEGFSMEWVMAVMVLIWLLSVFHRIGLVMLGSVRRPPGVVLALPDSYSLAVVLVLRILGGQFGS